MRSHRSKTVCFLFYFKEFVGNKNADYGTSVILPVPIEAVFVRINPTSWENNIALKVEFYGCKLNQPLIPGTFDLLKHTCFMVKGFLPQNGDKIQIFFFLQLNWQRHLNKIRFS